MTVSTTDPDVLVSQRGHALWITINRQERRNALNASVIGGIHETIRWVATHAQGNRTDLPGKPIRAIVLTGAGEKAFCAGADLTVGASAFSDDPAEPSTDFGRLARSFRALGIPSIARVNGDCIAGGMGLMALCDLAIVASHARFGLPEAKVGVFPMQVLVYLRRMLHPRHVNELCLTGELIGAARAFEIGIANQVVALADLDERVEEMVARLCAASPVALRRGKYALAAMEAMEHGEALAFAEGQIALLAGTADAREGLAAFVEKRKPAWARPDEDSA